MEKWFYNIDDVFKYAREQERKGMKCEYSDMSVTEFGETQSITRWMVHCEIPETFTSYGKSYHPVPEPYIGAHPQYALDAKQKFCSYLAKKIAEENEETEEYNRLEARAQELTHGHIFLDVLMDAQRTEVDELKKLYNELCG